MVDEKPGISKRACEPPRSVLDMVSGRSWTHQYFIKDWVGMTL